MYNVCRLLRNSEQVLRDDPSMAAVSNKRHTRALKSSDDSKGKLSDLLVARVGSAYLQFKYFVFIKKGFQLGKNKIHVTFSLH